ncbi:hypothetical protein [Desertibaculum subflavum]|uniref:hypothetical protein n=1 Tax=Desertibaculum subflavum TaxID=2268458 RepID=UPI0013C4701D
MHKTCDATTIDVLRRIVGMNVRRVYARRYPGYPAYSELVVLFAGELQARIDLDCVAVAPKFEVCVARLRLAELPDSMDEWDKFEFGDFIVAGVSVLRRQEWIGESSKGVKGPVGSHPLSQTFATLDEEGGSGPALVDCGVCLRSSRGAELIAEADTFPLVLQLRYLVVPSPLPDSTRIPINEHQFPQ